MATGELRATMALTEPGGGSDLQAIRTTARREGEEYVINGSKTWISNARRSGLIALLCKTDSQARPRHKGVSILLVEKGLSTLHSGLHPFARPAQARVQGRRELRDDLRADARPHLVRYFRDAPLMIVGEGTNEIQRNASVRQLVKRGSVAP